MTVTTERPEEVRDAAYYDAHYAAETLKPYSRYMLYPVWQQVIMFLGEIRAPRIIELGCGTGGLAHYIHDMGMEHYTGIDFSQAAIDVARKRIDLKYLVEDITKFRWDTLPHDAIIAVEVLEHLEDDVALLRRVRPGAHVIFSVPNLKCAGHVRWFGNPKQAAERYRGIITLQKTETFEMNSAKWFVCHGVRNG